jgi:hypothetical protein
LCDHFELHNAEISLWQIKSIFMKNLLAIIAVLICTQLHAQKGVNKLVLGVDIGFPTGDFADLANIGAGPMAKILFGVTPAGDITATTGVAFYSLKKDNLGYGYYDDLKGTWSVIPILVGYRHNLSNGIFFEPQLGMGVYALRAKYQGSSESDSETAFTWAAGIGYAKKNLEIGGRYQSGENDGSLSQFLIHIGYVLPLKSRR